MDVTEKCDFALQHQTLTLPIESVIDEPEYQSFRSHSSHKTWKPNVNYSGFIQHGHISEGTT